MGSFLGLFPYRTRLVLNGLIEIGSHLPQHFLHVLIGANEPPDMSRRVPRTAPMLVVVRPNRLALAQEHHRAGVTQWFTAIRAQQPGPLDQLNEHGAVIHALNTHGAVLLPLGPVVHPVLRPI